ncbi:MAG: glycosyltransferase family 2 protein [Solirubrobacteraceae bacterium]
MPSSAPRVSVIIASYRWPEALRTSLDTALAQTVQDIEVLVIEDSSDRASRAVVAEAHDRRAQWTCLAEGTGSQSGPNQLGWDRARAPVVAYLGHDDVWHPEHLERLLSVLDPAADAAHAVTVLLGADEDRRLLLAGSSPWEPTTFVPPSSLAHWRDSPRIGPWTAPEHSSLPVDHAFLVTAHARGARFVTSEAATVFKHPASWRLDSYRTRDATPQRRVHERLRSEPRLGDQLVQEARAAGVAGVLAAPPIAAPGVIADYNRRLKGLPARFAPLETRWTPDPSLVFPGWYAMEIDETGRFAWTGPQERALVRLDSPGEGKLGVRVKLRQVLSPGQLAELQVDLDGALVELERSGDPAGEIVLTGWLGRGARQPTVEVGVSSPVALATVRYPESPDGRLLGVAVAEIELLDRAH